MKTHSTVLTRKGQTTIPLDIRLALDLKEGDRVEWIQEGPRVWLRVAGSVVERTAGVFKPTAPPLSADELREAAERAIAEGALERTGS
jgi:AbrB family looped-hinge helix DNA binding protein